MIAELVKAFLEIVKLAAEGDPVATAKLKDILPETMHTEMVARRWDILDEIKFGPKP